MKERIYSSLIMIISFIIFIFTLAPNVYYTDSGELATAAITLGIAHPTGYPLFVIIGHLWSLLPFSHSPIFQLNLLSALLVAISSGIIFYIVNKLISLSTINDFHRIVISSFSALTFSTALTFWELSNSIEVYPLQVCLFSLIILFTLKAKLENNHYWYIVSLLVGLGFSNHLSIIFIIPGLLYVFFIELKSGFTLKKISMRQFIILLFPFIIGISFYIYLPLRSASLPVVNWGWVHRSLSDLLYHIQGKQYQIWMFSGENLGLNIRNYFFDLPFQLGIIGVITLFFGILKLYKANKDILIFFMISAIFNFIYAINYSIHDIASYFALSLIILIALSAIGFVYLIEKFNKNLVYIIILLPIINLVSNYKECNENSSYFVEDYTKAVCSTLDSNAIIITAQWDYFNSAMIYYQGVENYRKDITIVEKELMRRTWYPLQFELLHPDIYRKSINEFKSYQKDLDNFEKGRDPITYQSIQSNYIKLFKSIIDNNIDSKPIYIGLDVLQSEPELINGYNIIPKGMSFQIVKENKLTKFDFDDKLLKRFIELSIHNRVSYLDSGIVDLCSMNFFNTGRYYQSIGDKQSALKSYNLSYKINQDVRILGLINELK